MSETPTTPAPAPMSAYRLARVHQIRQMVEDFSEDTPGRPTLARAFADLFADRSWLMLETVRLEARAAEAEAANKELQEEQDGLHWLTQKHAKILTGVVNALRGTPPPLTLWSHHDAAELAVAMVARAAEAEAQVAMLKTELAEQERELSYERQMRQQTEEAMIALAGRVKRQTAELAEQEVDKLALVKELGKSRQDAGYVSPEKSLPERSKTVLLQPRHERLLPEFGRLEQDEHGPYWQVSGQRSTRYDISNFAGWAYLPRL